MDTITDWCLKEEIPDDFSAYFNGNAAIHLFLLNQEKQRQHFNAAYFGS